MGSLGFLETNAIKVCVPETKLDVPFPGPKLRLSVNKGSNKV